MRLSPSLFATLLTASLVTPRIASAQIEAGQVVDDSLRTPLQHVVVSLRKLVDGNWQLVDSAKTDERGLFQFKPTAPGIFRVGVLGTLQPQFAGGVDTLAADSVNERMFLVPMLRSLQNRVYFAFQVETPADVADFSRTPTYPPELRAKRLRDEVDAQFVVDSDGSVDIHTFKVLRSSRPEFVDAVRTFLITARYAPARIGGRAVRQIVQQQFIFDVE